MEEDNMQIPEMEYDEFNAPIPGQSLTNDPDQKYPWEQPSEYTSVKDAREKIFLDLLEPNRLRSVIELMSTKVPVNTIAQVVLREGFNKGKFNPDMMLNLLEPTMFMLMALAERQGIDYIIHNEELNDEMAEKQKYAVSGISSQTALPETVEKQIEELSHF